MKNIVSLLSITFVLIVFFFANLNGQNIDSLEQVLETDLSDAERYDILVFISDKLASGKDPDKGLEYISRARKIETLKDSELSNLDLIEGIAYGNKGEYNKAIVILKKRIAWLESSNYKIGNAVSYYELGVAEALNFESENAMLHLTKSDSFYRIDNDKKGQALCANGIGGVMRRNGQTEKAIEKYEEALAIYQEINDNKGMADSYNNLANAYGELGEYKKSESYYKKQEKIDLELGYEAGLGILYENMGTLMGRQNDFNTAIQYYEKSLGYHKKFGNKKNISNVLLMMGYCMTFIGKEEEGLETIKESIKVAEEADLKVMLPRTYKALSDINEGKGNYKEAYEYFKKHTKVKNELSNENVKKQIAELDAKYENEKNEKEIISLNAKNEKKDIRNFWMSIGLFAALLLAGVVFYFLRQRQKNNLLLKEKNEIISKALGEKNILLKEIHHRVKNNLQVISSLLNLQSQYIDDSKAIEAINEGRSRVHSMALIHQSLYQKDNLVEIDVKVYFEKLISDLFHTYKVDHDKIILGTDIEDLQLDVDTMIPLGLIMNELVTNALKYAFVDKDAGNLLISLKEVNHKLILKVKDDGVGIGDLELLKNNDSFGYQLIEAFIAKMEGEIDIQSENGTSVTLLIKNYKSSS